MLTINKVLKHEMRAAVQDMPAKQCRTTAVSLSLSRPLYHILKQSACPFGHHNETTAKHWHVGEETIGFGIQEGLLVGLIDTQVTLTRLNADML